MKRKERYIQTTGLFLINLEQWCYLDTVEDIPPWSLGEAYVKVVKSLIIHKAFK